MKRSFAVILSALFCVVSVHAGDLKVEAVVATGKNSKPAETFEPDVKKLYTFFKSQGSTKGDKFRAVWIAEDVGDAADPNTKIDEATLTADEDNFYGAFSLSKPTKGWPEGSYRVDIYSGDELATSVKFTIKKGAKSEDSDDDSSSD
jgi:hypothetical protein